MPPETAPLELLLLGSPAIILGGQPLRTDRRKATALLAYLAVTRQPHQREALATLLWPEYDQARAHANLRRVLWVLNDFLGKAWIAADRNAVQLQEGYTLDVHAFLSGIQGAVPPDTDEEAAVHDLSQSVSLYRGPFLSGFTLRDAPEFDAWQSTQVERLHQALEIALERLIQLYTRRAEWATAIHYARRWLEADPLHEQAHHHLIQLLCQSGRRAAAIRHYESLQQLLASEGGITPPAETIALYQQLLQETVEIPEPSGYRQALPVPSAKPRSTPLFGRRAEVEEIKARLHQEGCRLLTLTGVGGVGKSHLAQVAAERLGSDFEHGAYFIPLAPLSGVDGSRQEGAILWRIAQALHFVAYPEENPRIRVHETPEQQLLSFLHDRELLLVLDGFDHLLASASLVTELLARTPRLSILLTTRERLGLAEEWVLRLEGLAYSDGEPEAGAVALFAFEAQRLQPSFSLLPDNLAPVVAICRLVAGLPLAIQLAAAWTSLLSCREIAEEISQDLQFLVAAYPQAPERHSPVESMLRSCWQRLSPTERRVLCQISLFPAAFRREAVEYVAACSLGTLAALVNKSVLEAALSVRDGESRYELHPLLRRFATERFAERSGAEQRASRHRYATYYLDLLRDLEAMLDGTGQAAALDLLDAEFENVYQAVNWALEQGRVEELVQIRRALYLWFELRGQYRRGEQFFDWAVTRAAHLPRLKGVLLTALAWFRMRLGNFAAARAEMEASLALLEEVDDRFNLAVAELTSTRLLAPIEAEAVARRCLAFFQEAGDPWYTTMALYACGSIAAGLHDLDQAEHDLLECLQLRTRMGDAAGAASVLRMLGTLALRRGEFERARHWFAQALPPARALGSVGVLANSLLHLGLTNLFTGRYQEAEQQLAESAAIAREVNNLSLQAWTRSTQGLLMRALGDYDAARGAMTDGVNLAQRLGDTWSQAVTLERLAGLALLQGALGEAARLYGQSLAIAQQHGLVDVVGAALRGLGEAALARGHHPRAVAYLSENLDLDPALMGVWERPRSLAARSRLALLQGQTESARAFLCDALEASLAIRSDPLLLTILADAAQLETQASSAGESLTLLTLIVDHPATPHEVRCICGQRLAALAPRATWPGAEPRRETIESDRLRVVARALCTRWHLALVHPHAADHRR